MQALGILMLILGVGSTPAAAESHLAGLLLFNIYGEDNRVIVGFDREPYSKIVRLSGGCTGALVGRDLVLTAAHCVRYQWIEIPNGKPVFVPFPPQVYFKFDQGKYEDVADSAQVHFGTLYPNQQRSNDWVILRINQPLGDKYGWFEDFVEKIEGADRTDSVALAGYSGDRENGQGLLVDPACRIRGVGPGNIMRHDCDMAPGASGSPLFRCSSEGRCVIVALNVAQVGLGRKHKTMHLPLYSQYYTNLAVGAHQFAEKIRELRAETEF